VCARRAIFPRIPPTALTELARTEVVLQFLDYYGRIWITHPGTYHFQMISDDGALLEIDGKRVIDLDGIHAGKTGSGDIALVAGEHTVHIPYFQGPRAAVLMLWVEAPGEVPTLFDTRNFVPPPAMPGGR